MSQPLVTTILCFMSLVFVFLCLTDITQHNVLSFCSCFCKWQNLLSKWMNFIYIYIFNTCNTLCVCIYVYVVCMDMYVYISHIYPFDRWWTLSLVQYLGYCEKCFSEHGVADIIFLRYWFVFFRYIPRIGIARSYSRSIF